MVFPVQVYKTSDPQLDGGPARAEPGVTEGCETQMEADLGSTRPEQTKSPENAHWISEVTSAATTGCALSRCGSAGRASEAHCPSSSEELLGPGKNHVLRSSNITFAAEKGKVGMRHAATQSYRQSSMF